MSIRSHPVILSFALAGLALAAPATAFGYVSVTRAELKPYLWTPCPAFARASS